MTCGLPKIIHAIPANAGIPLVTSSALQSTITFGGLAASPFAGMTEDEQARSLTQQFLLELLGHFLDIFRRPSGDIHAETQTHRGQHFLDLVQ